MGVQMKYNLLSKYKIEKRIAFLEKALKTEAKQVGTLYHVCTLDAYLKWILPNDTLQASGKYYNWVYGGDNYVSFTRDKYFVVGTKSVQASKVLIQLVIDGDKLSENYKIGPYNDFAFDPDGKHVDDGDAAKYREKEEACKGPIKNLSKYVKEVRLDTYDMDSSTITKIRKSKLLGTDVKYFHFIMGYQSKSFTNFLKENGVKNGTPLDDAMKVFVDYVNRDKFNELLFSYDEDDIKKAIKGKADLNAKYPSGYVLEEYVTDDSNVEFVKMFLDAGADPNLVMSGGYTPLMLAAEYDNPDIIKELVSGGADVNKGTIAPIIVASTHGSKNAVQALIDSGADVNIKTAEGDTALSKAKTKQIAAMLKKAGATE